MRLGEQLRAQRERMGLTLEQAAEDTRIREKFLAALENGDYATLPGAVYTKGFLRNYAEYLALHADELTELYHQERGAADPPRSFEPMRPIMRRNLILTPAILLPVLILVGVGSFLGYLYYQFSTFAVSPALEVTSPAPNSVTSEAEYTVHGRTVADGRVTVRVFPGPETVADIRPASDGAFSAQVSLKPGPNHITVQVLDQSGKVSQKELTLRYEAAPTETPSDVPQLIVEQPASGGTYTNAPVTVSGRIDPSVATLLVNGAPVAPQPDGRFSTTVNFTAGAQTIRVVARTPTGSEVQETRAVTVAYTAAFVSVRLTGDAWILATVDGAQVASTNRIFRSGQTLSFTGTVIDLRTGNGGATLVSFNGQDQGQMGTVGQVVQRIFTAP